jgi:hypothetical protein
MSSGSSGIKVTVPVPSRSIFLDFCFIVYLRVCDIRYGGVSKCDVRMICGDSGGNGDCEFEMDFRADFG